MNIPTYDNYFSDSFIMSYITIASQVNNDFQITCEDIFTLQNLAPTLLEQERRV